MSVASRGPRCHLYHGMLSPTERHHTPESIPETTPVTQRPQAPLRKQDSDRDMVQKGKQKDVCKKKRGRTGDSRLMGNNMM